MPKKSFYLDQDKQERINITSGFSWRNTKIIHNGSVIGSFKNQKELKEGGEFTLDSERNLSVKLAGKFQPELELLINGEVIKGSPTDPAMQLKNAGGLAIGIGSLSILAGFIAEVWQIPRLLEAGIGIGSIIVGVVIIILGIFVKKRSFVALAVIVGLIILDIVAGVYFAINSTTDANPSTGVIIKVFFLMGLFKGFRAIKELRKRGE